MKFLTYSLLILHLNLCQPKERYNPVNDFLLHEAGGPVSPYNKDSNSQFPSLKPVTPLPNLSSAVITQKPPTSVPNNKRDYVAQFPALKPVVPTAGVTQKPTISTQTTAKRDYVAPQYPTLKPISNPSFGTTPKVSTQPKRDYVNPNRQNNQPGKVKDLINFYDNKNQGSPDLPKVPSYSTILKGSTNNPQPITPAPSRPNTPTKPTYSTVSGPKSTKLPNVNTNGKPNTLPSSILNNKNVGSSGGGTSDSELQALSEELLKKDVNNAAKFVTVNYQEKTTSQATDDKAPKPLLTISPEVWNIPTIQKFVPLLDNYERDATINEYVTAQERNEENAFMDAVMSTSVIRHLLNFFKDKGYVTQDPRQQRDFLKQIWFGLYSRGRGKISSSGFEHIFVSELKNEQISGLHNWIYFSKEEAANRANYLGYLKYTNLGDKGAVLKLHFNQQGVTKPVGTMFIGTSPELEMALYTLCYVTRVEKDCKLKLGGSDVDIVTYNYRYRSKNYIGSAYPQI